jgi:hypothetical protein
MGTLVVGGKELQTPFDTVTFLDNPQCKLGPRSVRKRGSDEQKGLCGIIVHTTGGIPGGKDLRPQVLKSGAGPSTNAGPKYASMWQTDLSKFGGAHCLVDFDGKVYQCCDLLLDAAYHAELANGRTIGIEVCQDRSDAGLYEIQVKSNVKLVSWLTAQFGIQRQICKLPYEGKPVDCLAGKLTRYGVFGHRNLTSKRGSGDPGDYLLQALSNANYEEFDFDTGEDLEIWKNRQGSLGLKPDGVPGPATVAALKEAGYHNGLWVPDAT